MIIPNGTIVDVYEDPITQFHLEGKAKVISHLREVSPGLNAYEVQFIESKDYSDVIFERRIADEKPCFCFEKEGDNENCPQHGHATVNNRTKA